jgi:hypothetical protein
MADFATTDLSSLTPSGSPLDGVTTDLLWYFGEPPVPPDPAPGAEGFQRVTVDLGRIEWAKFLGTIITGGQVSYFKLGEGGWRESAEVSSVVGVGIGITYVTGTIPGPPLIPNSVSIEGAGQVVTDDPSSPYSGVGRLSGDGVGTINYKDNTFAVTFTGIIPGGVDVTATRKHRGVRSEILAEDISVGNGLGPYASTLGVYPVLPGSVRVFDTGGLESFSDDGNGVLTGDAGGSGTIVYLTGAISVLFGVSVGTTDYVRAEYRGEGMPKSPGAGQSALVADGDSELGTFQKTLVPNTDMVFQGVGSRTVLVTLGLATGEGNDDGTGNPPFWTEGALYSENDVMLVYFTLPGTRKTSSVTFERQLELTVQV